MLEKLKEAFPVISAKIGLFGDLVGRTGNSALFKAKENGIEVLRAIDYTLHKMTKKVIKEPVIGNTEVMDRGFLTVIKDLKKGIETRIASFRSTKNPEIADIQKVRLSLDTGNIMDKSRVIAGKSDVLILEEHPCIGKVTREFKRGEGNRLFYLGESSYNMATCNSPHLKI